MSSSKWALAGVLAAAFSFLVAGAAAQATTQGLRTAQAAPAADPAAPPAQRPQRRIRIYPRYQAEPDDVYPRFDPGPNAVRVCSATYVPEYRPSGTVIVPHMNCVWRRG